MKTQVLKPGLLVALHTTVKGGVSYRRIEVEAEHRDEAGALVAKWETERTVPDPEEYERGIIARGAARSAIARVCCASSFGLLCPIANEADLQAGIEAARKIAEDFNATATGSRLEVFCIAGRIAVDDVEAARAIAAEVRELIESMREGIKAADPEAIREAANKARNLGAMLTPEVAGQVSAAIIEARTAARAIVKRVSKAGERAADVVRELSTRALDSARFAFLDLDEGASTGSEAPAARGLDLVSTERPEDSPEAYARAVLDLEEQGLSTSDAQAAVDATITKRNTAPASLPFELEA